MPEPVYKRAGRHLARVRQARGLSQSDVSEAVGISRNWLSQVETGAKQSLSLDLLERICRALDMTVKEFFDSLPGA